MICLTFGVSHVLTFFRQVLMHCLQITVYKQLSMKAGSAEGNLAAKTAHRLCRLNSIACIIKVRWQRNQLCLRLMGFVAVW